MVENIEYIKTGVGFGTVLATTISWSLNKSIFWAIVHGFFGWQYVIYYAKADPKSDRIDR